MIEQMKAFLTQLETEAKQAAESGNKEALADLHSIADPLAKLEEVAQSATKAGLKTLLEVGDIVGEWKKTEQRRYDGGAASERVSRVIHGDRFFEEVIVFNHKEMRTAAEAEQDTDKKVTLLEAIEDDKNPNFQIRRAGGVARADAVAEVVERIAESIST